ncbi:MAG: ribbon-helix-helix protein, CopG family [Vicinamibacterales bacterium]
MRTIVDLTDSHLEALDALCEREAISRAEAVRRAVAEYTKRARAAAPDQAFGLWRTRIGDGLAYERRLRREWRTPAGRR